jgi:hypothetical protein
MFESAVSLKKLRLHFNFVKVQKNVTFIKISINV